MASKKFSPLFEKRHPGQISLLTLLDDKSIEKRRFALHGHGIVVIDPTIDSAIAPKVLRHEPKLQKSVEKTNFK